MKTALIALTLALLAPAAAEAKITIFSTSDAVKKFMNSEVITPMERAGSLSSLTVRERDDSNAHQAFEMMVTFNQATQVGPRPCTYTVNVMVVVKKSPNGITYSEMQEPFVSGTACAP